MAEEKKVEAAVETVAKADYDALVAEYQKLAAAYNKAIGLLANNYAENVSKNIFAEVAKEAQK